MKFKARLTDQWRSRLAGALLVVLCGLWLRYFTVGQGLEHRSYDLALVLAPTVPVDEVEIVSMDESSQLALGQRWPLWDRSLHAQLLDKLRQDQCPLVVFDILMADTSQSPAADAELARAIKAHGKVVLAAVLELTPTPGGIPDSMIRAPLPEFRHAGAQWGLTDVNPDTDTFVRKHYRGAESDPSIAWKAAELVNAPVTAKPRNRLAERWLRYYGPRGTIPSLGYDLALDKPDKYFKDKIVFVGGKPRTLALGEPSDLYPTPFTRRDGQKTPGVEINATTFLNLVRGDWLSRLSPWKEFWLLLGCGVAFGFGLNLVRPLLGALIGLTSGLVIATLAAWLVWQWHVWFSWLVLAGAQIPCAWAWSVVAYAKGLSRDKEELKEELITAQAERRRRLPARAAGSPPHGTRAIPKIPGHDLLHCIGKGAFGEVWLARSVVGLYHAVKIVYREEFKSAGPYEWEFKGIEKFMPVSLDHPGLLRILHVDRDDEAEYFHYIMEIGDDEVSGQNINPDAYSAKNLAKEIKRRGRIPIEECLPLFLSLTEALQFLHQQRLLHRDIKPSNIIYVNGLPKFADIGLVTGITPTGREGTSIGTVPYMAQTGLGTPAGDVYSLGIVMYEASTGCDPRAFPALPTTLVSRADSAEFFLLNEIFVKACEFDLQDRYASAAELRAALLELHQKMLGHPKA